LKRSIISPNVFNQNLEATAANTEAITKIGNFGDWVAASMPFTPTVDGFLYIWLNPSSTSGAYVRLTYVQNSRTIQLALNAKAGDGISGIFPVKKGCQITQAILTNGTAGFSFMPLA